MERISHCIEQAVQDLFNQQVTVGLDRPDVKFGDYATNVALQLAKPLGKNPREVAEQLAANLRETGEFKEVSIAGPGFINLKLPDATLLELAAYKPVTQHNGKSYVIEYSCPNAFKELHTGHLYNTIFGDILARLIEAAGATVNRTSFGGDVGLHVGKCLWGIVATLEAVSPDKLKTIEDDAFKRANWISACYVRGAGAYEEDDEAKQEIDSLNKAVYAIHDTNDHESPLAQIYWTTRQWSYDYFEAFYKVIGVDKMRYYPESATAPTGLEVVKQQLEKGNLQESEGAIVFVGDEDKHLHTRVFITSKGLPTYETKDIGVIWLEQQDYNFDHRILITGNDQKEYMRVVYAAAETFKPELAGKMTHITNGTVRFGDGTKMSSRLGNVSSAIDVVDAVTEKVKELVKDTALVNDVALGAIKYVFAKYRIGGDVDFNIDETVSLAGNSGPYIQYAHARACSILDKSTAEAAIEGVEFDLAERTLLHKIGEYNQVIARAVADLEPHHICTYLYELAQEFNRFYESSRIIGDEREVQRVGLATLYRDTLARGLGLLGIKAPTRM